MTTLSRWLDSVSACLGRLLIGTDYQTPEWQKIPETNPIDELINSLKHKWESSEEAYTLDNHINFLREKGFNKPLYIIDTAGNGFRIDYTYPGKSVFLMYGIKPKESGFYPVDQTPIHTNTLVNTVNSLALSDDEYTPTNGDPPVREQFWDSSEKQEICHRLLRPYQQLNINDHQTYYSTLAKIFDPYYNVSLFKAVAIADEISEYLLIYNKSTSTPLVQEIESTSSSLSMQLSNIFMKYIEIDNEEYTEDILRN